MKIQMPDGTTIDTKAPTPPAGIVREETINGVPGIAFYDAPSKPGEVIKAERTRVDIATQLEAAEESLVEAQTAVVTRKAEIASLIVELRNFGKKTRAKKVAT